jgi:hypothetical protein
MPIEMLVRKKGGMLFPVMDDDKEKLRGVPKDQVFKIALVRQSQRSLKHHQLYWSGLIGLVSQYWAPETGTISPTERAVVFKFAGYLSGFTNDGDPEWLTQAGNQFLQALARSRADKMDTPEPNRQAIHDWIKEELNLYELYLTPSGWKKKLKSINFNAMTQDEFNEFYKNAFSLAWRFILSRHFESEDAAQNAVNEMLALEG